MPASTDAKVPATKMSSVQADHGKLISGGDSDWRSAKKCMIDWRVNWSKGGARRGSGPSIAFEMNCHGELK